MVLLPTRAGIVAETITPEVGTQFLTFHANGLSVTVQVVVTDGDETDVKYPDPDDPDSTGAALTANNFVISKSAVAAANSTTDPANKGSLEGYADAKTWTWTLSPPAMVQQPTRTGISHTPALPEAPGTYALTFTANGLTVTVQAVVANDEIDVHYPDPNDPNSTGAALTANNFSIKLEDAPSLTALQSLEKSGALTWVWKQLANGGIQYVGSTGPTKDGISVKAADLAAITGATATGTFPLTLTANGKTVIVQVTITDDRTFTVTFNADGGNISGAATAVRSIQRPATTLKQAGIPLPVATRNNYRFIGWHTAQIGGTLFSDLTVVNSNITVWARWELIQETTSHTVTYDSNGATKAASPGKDTVVTPNTRVTKLPTPPTRTGYAFDGWNTKKNGSGKVFNTSYTVTGSMTVYAQWDAKTYTLRFNLNGGSGATPSSQNLNYGDKADAPANPGRSGYQFLSWNTKRDGSGTAWRFASNTMPASDVTLYAQWRQNGYVVPPITTSPAITPTDPTEPAIIGPVEPDPRPDEPDPLIDEPEPADEPFVDDTTNTNGDLVEAPESESYEGFTEEEEVQLNNQTGNILTDLGNGNVPLGNFFSNETWSILSMLLSIAAVIIAMMLLVVALVRRKRKEELYANDELYTGAEQYEKAAKKGRTLRVLTIIAGALTLVVWLILDNFNQPATWINRWTIVIGIFFAVQLALFVIYLIRRGRKNKIVEEEYVEETKRWDYYTTAAK
jgi:uncharacterized repeat protein (TIGR02543 family)